MQKQWCSTEKLYLDKRVTTTRTLKGIVTGYKRVPARRATCASPRYICDPSSRVLRSRNTCTTCSLGATWCLRVFNVCCRCLYEFKRREKRQLGIYIREFGRKNRTRVRTNKWPRELERVRAALSSRLVRSEELKSAALRHFSSSSFSVSASFQLSYVVASNRQSPSL